MAVARSPGAEPGSAGHAAAVAPGGVGPVLPDGEQLPAGVRRPVAAQAGARALAPALPAHRVRHGLPLRGLSSAGLGERPPWNPPGPRPPPLPPSPRLAGKPTGPIARA